MALLHGMSGTGVCADWRDQSSWTGAEGGAPAWSFRRHDFTHNGVAPGADAPRRDAEGVDDWRAGGSDAYSRPTGGGYFGSRSDRPTSPYEAGFEGQAPIRQPGWRTVPDGDDGSAAIGPRRGGSARDAQLELDLGRLPSYGAAIGRQEGGTADFRFRSDPTLPTVRSQDAPWGEQYRFRPLEREGRRGGAADTRWRPWKDDSGHRPPQDDHGQSLFDSMSGGAGSPPDPYSPWRSR